MYLVKWKHLFLSVTNAVCFWLAYADKSPFVQKTQAFEKFFMQRIELYDKDEIERKGSILVDYKELIEDRELTKSIPNISTELRDMPQKILQCMGLAIH